MPNGVAGPACRLDGGLKPHSTCDLYGSGLIEVSQRNEECSGKVEEPLAIAETGMGIRV